MYNFTGFTEKANNALNKAVETAEDLGHTYIGSEHILLGLLDSTESVAGKLLKDKGITYKKVYDMIRESVGAGIPTELQPSDFTPRSKHIIEGALMLLKALWKSLEKDYYLCPKKRAGIEEYIMSPDFGKLYFFIEPEYVINMLGEKYNK